MARSPKRRADDMGGGLDPLPRSFNRPKLTPAERDLLTPFALDLRAALSVGEIADGATSSRRALEYVARLYCANGILRVAGFSSPTGIGRRCRVLALTNPGSFAIRAYQRRGVLPAEAA